MEESEIQTTESQPSTLNRWAPTLVIAALLMFFLYSGRAVPPPAGWGDDFAAAVEEAATANSRIVVEFYSQGCPPCKAMSRSVLGTGEVKAALEGLVPVRLDAWQNEQLSQRFAVFGTPTYVVFDVGGSVYARDEGYLSVEEFVAFVKRGADAATSELYAVGPLRIAGS